MCDQPWGAGSFHFLKPGSFHFLKLCIVRTQSMCRTPVAAVTATVVGSDRKGLIEMPKQLREEINDVVVKYLEHKLQTDNPGKHCRYGK